MVKTTCRNHDHLQVLFEVEAEHDFEATEDYQHALVAGQRYKVITDDTGNGWLQGRAADARPGLLLTDLLMQFAEDRTAQIRVEWIFKQVTSFSSLLRTPRG